MQGKIQLPILRLQLLGTPQIYLDERPIRDFVTRKAQALVIYLAVSRQAHTRDALANLFWRDLSNQQARNNLRRILPNLRKLVGSHLHIDREVVSFVDRASPLWLDTDTITTTLNKVAAEPSPPSIEQLQHALALYRGDFLEGFSVGDAPEFEAWALVQRENLRRLAIWGFDQLAAAYRDDGELEAGLGITNRLLALEPWYEAAHQKQMVLLARLGQRGAALAQYETCRVMLDTEFGAEPSPEMKELYEQLKAGAPSPIQVDGLPADDEGSRGDGRGDQPLGGDSLTDAPLMDAPKSVIMDWGMVPRATTFYGRQYELNQLKTWLLQERCTLVTLLGVGGVGKTALATQLVRGLGNITRVDHTALGFERVLWQSLVNAPPLETVLRLWLHELSARELTQLPSTLDELSSLLFAYLRRQSCLLVLDNLESILQEGEPAGHYQREYEDYAQFFQQMGESEHQSCLLLTSRELPLVVARLERTYPVVRTLRLEGLPVEAGIELVRAIGIHAPVQAMRTLVQRYSGNPLALRLVAEMVMEHNQGDAAEFLTQDTLVFEDIRTILKQQHGRLSTLEQEIVFWLTIEREPLSLQKLARNFVRPPEARALLEAIRSLYRRSLVEEEIPKVTNSDDRGVAFALQNVVLDYNTEQLREIIYVELIDERHHFFLRFALVEAQAADYVRAAQIRLILQPIAQRLLNTLGLAGAECKLRELLAQLHTAYSHQPGYAAANILHLAFHLGIQVDGWDFSRLPIWQADLRKAHLSHTNFAQARFLNSSFTKRFDAILAIAFSQDGELLAAGGASSNIHIWRMRDTHLLSVCPGKGRWIWAVAFSPNGQILASGGSDSIVHLWDVATLRSSAETPNTGPLDQALSGHLDTIFALAFSPDGQLLASASADQTIRLWDVARKVSIQTLGGHTSTVYALAFSPNGRVLASAGRDQTVRLWQPDTGECLQVLTGHQNQIIALAFSADGRWLVTASIDNMIQVWQVRLGETLQLPLAVLEHTYFNDADDVSTLALSPDGETIATNGPNATVRLRQSSSGMLINTLHGHRERSQSLAFSPDGKTLVSGGWDQTIRFWDVAMGHLLRTLQGYNNAINILALTPNGQTLVSGNADGTLCLWDTLNTCLVQVQHGHGGSVQTVAFDPSGRLLVSGGSDGTLRFWTMGDEHLNELRTPHDHSAAILSVCFSPSGELMASGGEDQTVRIWETKSWQCLHVLQGHQRMIQALVFSPDGKVLMSGSDDGRVYRWLPTDDAGEQSMPQPFAVLPGNCMCLAFSPDGLTLAGAGSDHIIHLWHVTSGKQVTSLKMPINSTVYSLTFRPHSAPGTLQLLCSNGTGAICRWDIDLATGQDTLSYVRDEHKGSVRSLQLTPDGQTLISGGADETIRFWDVETGQCLQTLRLEPPYVGMNIVGATGLSAAERAALIELGAVESPLAT